MELPSEDVPPEEIWHHDERLTEWWEAVKQRRKNPNDDRGMETVPQTDNELAEEYRQ